MTRPYITEVIVDDDTNDNQRTYMTGSEKSTNKIWMENIVTVLATVVRSHMQTCDRLPSYEMFVNTRACY